MVWKSLGSDFMAIIGKIYQTNDNIYGLYEDDLRDIVQKNTALILNRRMSSYDDNIIVVEYLIGENKQAVEETVFHYYFDLLEEIE